LLQTSKRRAFPHIGTDTDDALYATCARATQNPRRQGKPEAFRNGRHGLSRKRGPATNRVEKKLASGITVSTQCRERIDPVPSPFRITRRSDLDIRYRLRRHQLRRHRTCAPTQVVTQRRLSTIRSGARMTWAVTLNHAECLAHRAPHRIAFIRLFTVVQNVLSVATLHDTSDGRRVTFHNVVASHNTLAHTAPGRSRRLFSRVSHVCSAPASSTGELAWSGDRSGLGAPNSN